MKKKLMFALVFASAAVFAQNLLQDGNFASGKFGAGWTDAKWTPVWGEKTIKDGVLTFKNDKEEQYTLTHQSIKLVPGKYTISFETKSDIVPAKRGKKEVTVNGKKITFDLNPSAGPEIFIGQKTLVTSAWGLKKNADWKKFSKTFEVLPPAKGDAAAPVSGVIYVMLRHSTGTCSFRNLVLEKAK